jgi:tetratricopeptide (TPR) repeat protein
LIGRWNQRIREHPLLTSGILVLVIFALYGRALGNGFAMDDEQTIVQNPIVANPHWWRYIVSRPAWAFLGTLVWYTYYRPLQFFSYWFLWRIAGPNPGAYHLFQLLLYAASVWLVYRVGRELVGQELAAFAGALLWALHPVHVEAVAWAAALPDVGSGFFHLLAFLLFLRAEREGRWWDWRNAAGAVTFCLGLLFKEMALSLPVLMVAYWLFLGKPGRWSARVALLAPYLAVLGLYLWARAAVLGHLSAAANFWEFSPVIPGAALAMLGAHLRFFLWPVALSPVRTFNWSAELETLWPWAALLLLGGGWLLRKREPLLAFLIFSWVIALLPCLDIRQLTVPFAADRYSYLPTFGLCLAVGWFVMERLPSLRLGPRSVESMTVAVTVLALLWTAGTEAAIPHWRSSESLMQFGLRENPNSALPHIYKATDLQYRKGDLEGAAREFRTAMEVNSSSRPPVGGITCQADLGLGQIAYFEGRVEEALGYFQEVLHICPSGTMAFAVYDARGSIWFVRGEYAKAAEDFRQAIIWGPMDVSGHFYLGTCQMKLGQFREAAEQFRVVAEIDPSLWPAYEAQARALEAAGDTAAAARVRSQAPPR